MCVRWSDCWRSMNHLFSAYFEKSRVELRIRTTRIQKRRNRQSRALQFKLFLSKTKTRHHMQSWPASVVQRQKEVSQNHHLLLY